jgi:MFS family permease
MFLFEMLDNSILNVVLPTIGRELHASTTGLRWASSASIVPVTLGAAVARVDDRLAGQRRGGQGGEGLDRHRDHDDVTGRRGLPARRRECPRPQFRGRVRECFGAA